MAYAFEQLATKDGKGHVAPSTAPALKVVTETGGTVGGTVPATLSLTLGAPASFGAFTPGVAKEYTASTTANVISTAGDAALTVSDPGRLANGPFTLPSPLEVAFSKATWGRRCPTSRSTIAFKQASGERRAAHGHLLEDADVHAVDDEPLTPTRRGTLRRSARPACSESSRPAAAASAAVRIKPRKAAATHATGNSRSNTPARCPRSTRCSTRLRIGAWNSWISSAPANAGAQRLQDAGLALDAVPPRRGQPVRAPRRGGPSSGAAASSAARVCSSARPATADSRAARDS